MSDLRDGLEGFPPTELYTLYRSDYDFIRVHKQNANNQYLLNNSGGGGGTVNVDTTVEKYTTGSVPIGGRL